jgi:hypothetical protein
MKKISALKSSLRESIEWQPSGVEELQSAFRLAIKKQSTVSIFKVGPDDYFIKDAKVVGKLTDTYLLKDADGFYAGIDFNSLGDRVQKQDNLDWTQKPAGSKSYSFHVGDQEVQVDFE